MSLRAAYLNLGSFFGVTKKETLFPNSQIKTVAAERMAEKSSNLYLIPSATTWTCQFSALASKKMPNPLCCCQYTLFPARKTERKKGTQPNKKAKKKKKGIEGS